MMSIILGFFSFIFSGIGLLLIPHIVKWVKYPTIQLSGRLGSHGSVANTMGGVKCAWKIFLELTNGKHEIRDVNIRMISSSSNMIEANIAPKFEASRAPYAHKSFFLLLSQTFPANDFKQTKQSPNEYRENSPAIELNITFRNEAGRLFRNYYSIAVKDKSAEIIQLRINNHMGRAPEYKRR